MTDRTTPATPAASGAPTAPAAPAAYLDLRARSAAVFDLDAQLPGQVFREIAGDSLFCEYDAVLAPDFWPALSAMARWHGDAHVELLALGPGGETFRLPGSGTYGAVSVPVDATEDDYWAAIGYASDTEAFDSIAISANVIAVTGRSGRWGCWGERDPEIAVFRGFPDAAAREAWRSEFGPFEDVAGALDSYLAQVFYRTGVPDAYAAALSAHYGPVA